MYNFSNIACDDLRQVVILGFSLAECYMNGSSL
jgi:hypothetical protein